MSFRGAVKAVIPKRLFKKIGPFGHLVEAFWFNLINGFPARNLQVIGVTGTNGKTTTCWLIHRMLHEAGFKVGLMTTVGYGVGDNINPQIHHMTNVPVPELMKRLKEMKKQGAEWLVLETTSHALAQNRVWGVPFSLAVLTNVTHEHLDYHGTFENYRDAKRKLFQLCDANRQGLRIGVVNADDPSGPWFEADIERPLSYGINKGYLRASDIKATPRGNEYTAVAGGYRLKIKTNLAGSFNIYNTLAATAVGLALKLQPAQIEQGIAALTGVEGRMTTIDEGQPFSVIVDFAHTPDSFQKLFEDLRPMVSEKIIVMFGSAGRRDTAKRAVQGELAGRYADEVILTEEDDRDEDGMKILNEIAAGAEKSGKIRDKDLFLVHNREEAIKFTLGRAQAGDTVLLLGKGHEKTIERQNREDPWDEVEITRKALKNVGQGKS